MFAHVLCLLKPGGRALIVNQEEDEKDRQVELLPQSGIDFESFDLDPVIRWTSKTAHVRVLHR